MVYVAEVYGEFIKWMAVISSLLLYLAGSKVCLEIIRRKTTGDVTLFPYIASVYSGVVWTKYAMLTNVTQLMVVSAINAAAHSFYAVVFYVYARERRYTQKMLTIYISLLFAFLYYAKYFTASKADVVQKVGLFGAATTVLMAASPLVSLREVMQSKSTRSMDFWFILFCSISSGLWVAVGVIISDYNVMVPNFTALTVCIFQLSLFIMYPTPKSPPAQQEKSEITEVLIESPGA